MAACQLETVSIESLDWSRCVELYDSPETFFFLDPPYTNCEQKAYETWTGKEMTTVRDALVRLKGNFVLTVNDCPENRQIFGEFKLRSVERQRGLCNKGPKSERYRELIITA